MARFNNSVAPQVDGLHGVNASAVVDAIKQRYRQRKAGRNEPDGRKLALVFDGGAMRAVGPAGGAVALEHLGFTDIFDEVYATSAGVMNASYFLSGQGDMGITIYFDDLTTGRFINPLRFWKIVDVDYLINEIVLKKKPLDTQRVLNSPTRFYATVMDQATGEASLIDVKRSKASLLTIIKAALAIPLLYNRAVELEGISGMDGGLRIPFPLQEAIDHGCTDILVLLSRSNEYVCPQPSPLECLVFDLFCARGNRSLSQAFSFQHLPSRTARDLALGRAGLGLPGVNIAAFCTDRSAPIHRITVDRGALRAAAVAYGRRVLSAFGVEANEWDLGPASMVRWK